MTATEQKPDAAPQRILKVHRMPTDLLTPHQSYHSLFDPPPTEEIEALADEMRANPQLPCHVEATPDGTILYGWQFVQAARLAGWTEMEVTVRQDMDELNEYARELEMIDTHLRHGKLSPVTIARCLARAHETADFVPVERRRSYQNGELKNVVADYLKVGKRSAERYVAVTEMSPWLQTLFDRGEIKIAMAEKVKALSAKDEKAVRKAIEEGVKPRDAVAAHLPKKRKPFVAPARKRDRIVKLLRKTVDALTPLVREVKAIGGKDEAALLEMKALIDEVLQKAVGSSPGLAKVGGSSEVVPCGADEGDPNP
jgi:ParB-like chromosome segregation protein Spo0J